MSIAAALKRWLGFHSNAEEAELSRQVRAIVHDNRNAAHGVVAQAKRDQQVSHQAIIVAEEAIRNLEQAAMSEEDALRTLVKRMRKDSHEPE